MLQLATFRYYGNKGRSKVNFRENVKLRDREHPVSCKNFSDISYVSRGIANFVLKLENLRYHGNKGRSWVNFHDTVKLLDLEYPLLGARISEISRT